MLIAIAIDCLQMAQCADEMMGKARSIKFGLNRFVNGHFVGSRHSRSPPGGAAISSKGSEPNRNNGHCHSGFMAFHIVEPSDCLTEFVSNIGR